MSISRRWAVPAGVAAVVAAGSLVGPQLASAGPELPPTTAAQLLARLARAPERPFSGTVVQTTDLGLPKLPRGDSRNADLTALLTGSTTVRVWSDGPERSRVALLGSLSETDVVRNGRDVWTWNSRERTASHVRLPAEAGRRSAPERPVTSATTPEEAARQALAAIDPSTAVTLDRTTKVAGRGAYELVLRPRTSESLVGQVRIAVDSKTSLPLRVQVIPRGSSSAAYQTGFTDVSFGDPGAQVFRFTPPAGSKVTERSLPPGALEHHAGGMHPGDMQRGMQRGQAFADRPSGAPTVVGTDWTAVLSTRVDRTQLLLAVGGDQVGTAVLNGFRRVKGSYGLGRMLRTNLVNVLWLDDGRMFVGAVKPAVLERAAAASSASTAAR